VLKAWDTFADDYLFSATEVAHASHGRRLYDTLKEYCRINDEDKLQAEIARFEEAVIEGGPILLPGALALISQLAETAPVHAWTIVTSATNVYTPRVLQRCCLPIPPAGYVTSNDVSNGKPHPDPYFAGAKKCGVDPTKCLVVEDAPSGIRAGHAAGARTLAVCTSHTRQAIVDSGASPDYIVTDLTRVSVRLVDGKVEVSIDEDAE
jgi:HAD superfamily hydrolase (TIGR01509 family)